MRVVAALGCLLVAATSLQAQSDKAPTCRADRKGEQLITRIEYSDGYTVEGPWRVTAMSPKVMTAVLDRIIETQPVSHKRQMTPLPGPVEMTFEGNSLDELLTQAAHVWCMTVIQARPPWQPDNPPIGFTQNRRIM